MAKVLLGVTGSVAAIYTPLLHQDLVQAGHDVKIIATPSALYFFDPTHINPLPDGRRNPDSMILDEDEWPGREVGLHYQRSDAVLHIELRRWADVLLIAPLDANTLAKLAAGLCDNCLTCVWRAWDRTRPVLLAPAMNTLMWEHPLTTQHLRQLAGLDVGNEVPNFPEPLAACAWINQHCPRLRIIPPISKRLACDDVGIGAMAEREAILRPLTDVLRK